MTKELGPNPSTGLSEKNTGYGWGGFVKDGNPWIELAAEKNINLESQKIKAVYHPQSKQVALGKAPKIPRRIFAESPWTKWYDKRLKTPITFTISEYKRLFQGKLPDYALSFKSRGLDIDTTSSNRYKKLFVYSDSEITHNTWHIERERYLDFHKPHERVYVERLYDLAGKITDVTLLHFYGTNCALAARNHKVSSHVWESEMRYVLVGPFPPVPYTTYLNSKTPWIFKDL